MRAQADQREWFWWGRKMNSDTEIISIVTWLMADAPPSDSLESLVKKFAERLTTTGFPTNWCCARRLTIALMASVPQR